jgi:hypothetical protein
VIDTSVWYFKPMLLETKGRKHNPLSATHFGGRTTYIFTMAFGHVWDAESVISGDHHPMAKLNDRQT